MSVNFRIVEPNYEPMFNDFRRDFDNGVSKKDLREKYDIPNSVWFEWRDRIFAENPTHRRRFHRGRVAKPKVHRRIAYPEGFIKGTHERNFTVIRKIDGTRRSYGTYSSRDTAQKVLDELVAHKWNKYVAYDLINEHGISVSKKCLLPRILERES